MIKKILIKICLLILITIVLNIIYNLTFYKKDLAEKCEQILEINNNQATTDIFYFAESSNFNTREDDSIKNSTLLKPLIDGQSTHFYCFVYLLYLAQKNSHLFISSFNDKKNINKNLLVNFNYNWLKYYL